MTTIRFNQKPPRDLRAQRRAQRGQYRWRKRGRKCRHNRRQKRRVHCWKNWLSYECDGQEAKREVNLLGINDAEERFETKATSVRIFPIKQNEQKLVTWTETIDSRLIVLRFREKRCETRNSSKGRHFRSREKFDSRHNRRGQHGGRLRGRLERRRERRHVSGGLDARRYRRVAGRYRSRFVSGGGLRLKIDCRVGEQK